MLSSIWAARTAAGTIPAWASSARRRGVSMASTNNGLPEAIRDASLGEVIGRYLHHDLVAREHADAVLAHLAGRVRDDLVAVLQHDAKRGVGQPFADRAFEFQEFFFCHSSS